MLENYNTDVEYIAQHFEKKAIKKLKIESLINLSIKLNEFENAEIERLMLNLKSILRKILDNEPKQYRIYRKEFENLKKIVIEEYGYYQKGSIIEKHIGLGLVFGIAIGASLASTGPSFLGVGIAIGIVIGSAIGTRKEKEEEAAGNLY